MPFLPPTIVTLQGGCFCAAIRYTIKIPNLQNRPLIPNAAVETKYPLIQLDHCESCRRIAGSIIQCWLICPTPWVSWSLLKRSAGAGHGEHTENREEFSTLDVVYPNPGGSGKQKKLAETYVSHFSSSKGIYRSFCGKCGTNLTYYYERDKGEESVPHVDIAVGSLNAESLAIARPDRHAWWSDGVEWVKKLLVGEDTGLVRHRQGGISGEVET